MKRIFVGIGLFAAVAGVAYLATVGCGELLRASRRNVSWSERLGLSGEQKGRLAVLEKGFLAQSQATCGTLCAKRAQMITLLQQDPPDRGALSAVVEEIGAEQLSMERMTLDHVLAVASELDPPQRGRYLARVREELRGACSGTACGASGVCVAKGDNR
ncbi:MAG: periplasmic heavy metal sensor [Candidatus Omnitrophica bacterium]|nr:periplasmic heavy metal sensor [Candidatus Omnitrophota bacterium]